MYNIIISGVGGQGILSIAFVIDQAALAEGLYFLQSEVHGMSQRGGAVESHLRLSETEIFSPLIPQGEADLILSVEPLEALRYFSFLKPEGTVISSRTPYVNIHDYPPLEEVFKEIKKVRESWLIEAGQLAKQAGSLRAENMVVLGAASRYLPLQEDNLKKFIRVLFQSKGEKVVETNLKAFDLGRQAAESQA
ncbi:MAG TPA: indolepyruvate oxidoreductase subunit beta [Candidatus Saccharicenans sp.]|nr:indolepyruvate oxidoreductase subunit beta [Candidatus Saccharicenans sp.]HPU93715.1 indolepyruvate oxidoreductase subunit beta [Candidatus Saccharicenans sp.]